MKRSVHELYNDVLRIQDWNVGVIPHPISDFLKPDIDHKIQWLPSPGRAKYLADPFGLIRDNRIVMLCEEFDYSTGKGKIVSYQEDENHTFTGPEVALELPVHISYPYLVEWKGETYCVPETSRAREVSLYRAQEFPCR